MPMGAGEEAPRQDEGTCRCVAVEMASNRSFLQKNRAAPKKTRKKYMRFAFLKRQAMANWIGKSACTFLKTHILNMEMDSCEMFFPFQKGDVQFPSSFLRDESINQIFRMGQQNPVCRPVLRQKIHVYGDPTCR